MLIVRKKRLRKGLSKVTVSEVEQGDSLCQRFCWCDQNDSQIKTENCTFPRLCHCVCIYVFVVRKIEKLIKALRKTKCDCLSGTGLRFTHVDSRHIYSHQSTSVRCTIMSEFELQPKNRLSQKWVERDKIPFRELIYVFFTPINLTFFWGGHCWHGFK